jgi:hypothetical protein
VRTDVVEVGDIGGVDVEKPEWIPPSPLLQGAAFLCDDDSLRLPVLGSRGPARREESGQQPKPEHCECRHGTSVPALT